MPDAFDSVFDTPADDTPVDDGHGDTGAEDTTLPDTPGDSGHGDEDQPGADQGGDLPKLWAGKYKSPEEMEQAYVASQSHGTKLAMELATIKQQAGVPEQGQPKPGQEQLTQEQIQYMQQNPLVAAQYMANLATSQAMGPIKEQVDNLNMQLSLSRLRSSNDDFGQVAPLMGQVFKDNPMLWGLPNAVDVAYAMAKATYAPAAIKQAQEAGRQAAYQSKVAKQGAFAEGQKTKTQTQSKSPDDDMLAEIFKPGSGGLFG